MEGNTPLEVVMLPWSAFGHLTPFFQLSIALAEAGVHVSFISTPKNIQRLPKIPSTLAHLVDFVEFPLPSLDKEHLPEGAEATVDIPPEKIQDLKVAYDQLQHPVKQFVLNHSPDWIISDFCSHWVVEIAQEFQIELMFSPVVSAASTVFFGLSELLGGYGEGKLPLELESLTRIPEYVKFPSAVESLSAVAYQKHEALLMHPGQNASGIADGLRAVKLLHACQAVAIRSCYEIEGKYLNLCQKITKKPVIPVGLLPSKGSKREITEGSWGKMFGWLDKQAPKSVVFVGFGSECTLKKDKIFEIAYGLELSQLPFLWALRKPSWAIDDEDSLPPGFAERTSNRGIVCMGWVPQREILAHPSIGSSLFQSGWGSVIETLQFGHNLLVLPFYN
ncbi:hypothetical protein L6164_003918 [Bauhinia variegata]|uniref:Uncharacterized protein n=1 Tax=Bauhinia variegata TaxID=167791 RepID=A0ACB9Q4U3_BAUVA|nr:hypothetical protein L6164_003918 [Bauhinia variegata]